MYAYKYDILQYFNSGDNFNEDDYDVSTIGGSVSSLDYCPYHDSNLVR